VQRVNCLKNIAAAKGNYSEPQNIKGKMRQLPRTRRVNGATENAGVEKAGVSRMEHQTEIILKVSYVI